MKVDSYSNALTVASVLVYSYHVFALKQPFTHYDFITFIVTIVPLKQMIGTVCLLGGSSYIFSRLVLSENLTSDNSLVVVVVVVVAVISHFIQKFQSFSSLSHQQPA